MISETEFDDYSEDEDTSREENFDSTANKRDTARRKVDIRRKIEQRLEGKQMRAEFGAYYNYFDDSNASSLSEIQR
jgi:hypothetical protein